MNSHQQNDDPIVMILDLNCLGRAVQVGAYASWIEYEQDGDKVQTVMLNEEFEFLEGQDESL